MTVTLELGREEGVHDLLSDLRASGAPAHGKDVGVVVLAAELGGEVVVAKGAADAVDLVAGDGNADASPAEGDPALALAGSDLGADGDRNVGVINTLHLVNADVHDLVASSTKVGDEHLLELKSTVITTNSNLHLYVCVYVYAT